MKYSTILIFDSSFNFIASIKMSICDLKTKYCYLHPYPLDESSKDNYSVRLRCRSITGVQFERYDLTCRTTFLLISARRKFVTRTKICTFLRLKGSGRISGQRTIRRLTQPCSQLASDLVSFTHTFHCICTV